MRAIAILLSLLAATAAFAQEQDDEPFAETIYIVRYTLDVRVVDSYGNAIDDLKPEDFIVTVGRKTAHVEGADWISLASRASDHKDDPRTGEEEEARSSEPRSILLFIQTDFARNSVRVLGQMKFNYVADDIIDLFGPNDRVAVLSHDSHLKFRRDFTRDRDSLRKAVRESLYIDYPPLPPAATDGPSLLPLFDRTEMKRAAHAEAALLLIANAMRHIPGPKVIILAGWGVGELQGRSGVQLKPEWKDAVEKLRQDDTPVISLNHGIGGELSAGLAATSSATGGFYAGLQNFDSQAVTRVKGMLAGHYALTLRIDDLLKPGTHPLLVRVNRRGAECRRRPRSCTGDRAPLVSAAVSRYDRRGPITHDIRIDASADRRR
jgi:hypothetical protein